MSEINVDTLEKYGDSFQLKCIVALLSDRPFLEQSADVVLPEYFENDAHQWIVKKTLWYFNEYKGCPTIDVLKKESDKISEGNAPLTLSIIESLKNVFLIKKGDFSDIEYIKDEFLSFCKNQALKRAVMESVDLLVGGKYDQIKVIIDKALNAGRERNIGHVWMEEFDVRVSEVTRNVVPSPWEAVNAVIDGGLGAGELGCIVAPSGGCKSWSLAALGAHAVSLGKTVVHYTLELSETYLGLRYDCIFSGIEPNKIRDNQSTVQEIIGELPGKLIIKYFPSRSITVNTIRAHIERMCNMGNRPDIILIDYADLMLSADKSDSQHQMLGFIYEELRGLAGEYKVPLWTASQSNRDSVGAEIVESNKIAGSFAKIMACDLVLSTSRTAADKVANTARTHFIKNRFGPDGMTYPTLMDVEHGKIEIYDEESPNGKKLKELMKGTDTDMKKMLSQKFIDLQKKNTGVVSV